MVFRAHDERLDRPVALKIFAPAVADKDTRQRFIHESRTAAAVDHPHIIPIYEAGEVRGFLFIAMRLVRGGDLCGLLKREGRLAPIRAAGIVSQVASSTGTSSRGTSCWPSPQASPTTCTCRTSA